MFWVGMTTAVVWDKLPLVGEKGKRVVYEGLAEC
jgi:hypothetical protein